MESGLKEKIEVFLGEPIPDEDYLTFIEPYEWHEHLESIRASLSPEEIKEVKKVSYNPKIVPFPTKLLKQQTMAFRNLHKLIASIGREEGVSYARLDALKDDRSYALRLLWIFGCSGKLEKNYLEIDGKTYLANKMFTGYSKVVNHYFKFLASYGVYCEHIALKEKGWLTPGGALRPKDWLMRMTIDDALGGSKMLGALVSYAEKLDGKYGNKAFGFFSKGDMEILT